MILVIFSESIVCCVKGSSVSLMILIRREFHKRLYQLIVVALRLVVCKLLYNDLVVSRILVTLSRF